YNRANAGHLEWLLGCALFPGILALAIGVDRRWARAGAAGALLGLAGGQAQFMFFFPLAAAPWFLRARNAGGLAVSTLLMIALQVPSIVAMIFALRLGAFVSQRTNATWQAAQSDPLRLALVSGADPAHYFAHWEHGIVAVCSIVVIALAAAGSLANARTRILGVFWILSALWSSGLDGPLAAPAAWLFAHVDAAIAFREFAHAQAVTAPLVLILTAHALLQIARWTRLKPAAGAAATFAVVLPLIWPALCGDATRLTPGVQRSADRDAIVAQVRALPGSGQVLWWPGLNPISIDGSRGGVDSEAFPIAAHAPYVEYRPTAALAQAIAALDRGDRATCGLLADLGVEAIVVRDRTSVPLGAAFSSLSPPIADTVRNAGLQLRGERGAYHLYEVPCYVGRFTIARAATLEGDWTTITAVARIRGATDEFTRALPPPAGCKLTKRVQASYALADLTRGWVSLAQLDSQFLSWDNAFDDVLVTRQAALRANFWALAAPAASRYTWMPPKRLNALAPHGVAVWLTAQCTGSPKVVRPRGGSAPARVFHDGTFILRTPSMIVAHYGPYAGWSLAANGENRPQMMLADGYATGWPIQPGRWELAFSPAGPSVASLWAFVLVAGLVCGLMMLTNRR
ncbi:MAG: hypothetical protein WBD74_05020, partial [Candidatus Aquilonibacter sp.]